MFACQTLTRDPAKHISDCQQHLHERASRSHAKPGFGSVLEPENEAFLEPYKIVAYVGSGAENSDFTVYMC